MGTTVKARGSFPKIIFLLLLSLIYLIGIPDEIGKDDWSTGRQDHGTTAEPSPDPAQGGTTLSRAHGRGTRRGVGTSSPQPVLRASVRRRTMSKITRWHAAIRRPGGSALREQAADDSPIRCRRTACRLGNLRYSRRARRGPEPNRPQADLNIPPFRENARY